MKSIALIANGGIGDVIQAFQCGYFVREKGHNPIIYVYARKEVFDAIELLFGWEWEVRHVPDDKGDLLVSNEDYFRSVAKEEYAYLVWPDLLYTHRWGFPFKKYDCHPQIIKGVRLLTHKRQPRHQIYVGLTSTIPSYVYPEIPNLLTNLCNQLPEYDVYFPYVYSWAGKDVKDPRFTEEYINSRPHNLLWWDNPTFNQSFDHLSKAEYCICADNGISHVAFQFGIPRLLLDSRGGQLPWLSRWREDLTESINISASVADIVHVAKTNLKIPQTTLLPRGYIQANRDADWPSQLYLKYA